MASCILPREFAHYYSMSSLHTPISLTEYAIRREKFGEGKLCVRREGLLGDSAGQKYRNLQQDLIDEYCARPPIIPPLPEERILKTCTASAATLPVGRGLMDAPETLHGNIGTGNSLSHEFPLRKNQLKRGTVVSRLVDRVTTEERRILRTLVQYAVRNSPGTDRILLENTVIAGMLRNSPLKMKFFHDEAFALKLLEDIVEGQKKNALPPSEPTERVAVPNRHKTDCGPKCFCLKYQDAALNGALAKKCAQAQEREDVDTWKFASNVKDGQACLVREGRNIALGKSA